MTVSSNPIAKEKYQKSKAYKLANREKLLAYAKSYNGGYYQKNKERLLAKYDCPCGSSVAYCGKNKHSKTKKHIKFMEQSQPTSDKSSDEQSS